MHACVCVWTKVSAIVPRQKGQNGPWLERWAGVMSHRSLSLRMASVLRVKGALGGISRGEKVRFALLPDPGHCSEK